MLVLDAIAFFTVEELGKLIDWTTESASIESIVTLSCIHHLYPDISDIKAAVVLFADAAMKSHFPLFRCKCLAQRYC